MINEFLIVGNNSETFISFEYKVGFGISALYNFGKKETQCVLTFSSPTEDDLPLESATHI